MFDYLDKFNKLGDDIKMAVDSDEALKLIEEIEKEYNIELASVVMRVAIKEISIDSLPLILFTELNLNQEQSEKLAEDLKNKIFYKIADYLGFKTESKDEDKLGEQDFVSSYLKDDVKNKIEEQAKKIITILNLNFKDQEKDNKLFNLLLKFLKGIKSKIELREVLTKPIEMGGLALTDLMLDNVFIIAESMQKEEKDKAKKDTKVDKDVLDKINRLGYGALYDKNQPKMLDVVDGSHLLAPLHPSVIEDVPVEDVPVIDKIIDKSEDNFERPNINLDKFKEKIESTFVEDVIEEPAPAEISVPAEPLVSEKVDETVDKKEVAKVENKTNLLDVDRNTGKIKMTDVKKMKIMGPIDEIRYLDLVNFRRMSKDPKEALVKLGEKIKSLESLDYSKMLEAIKAWRQSPIHKLYLKIFLNAGNRGLSFDSVISELKSAGKDYLDKEELDAIIEFNKTLRF